MIAGLPQGSLVLCVHEDTRVALEIAGSTTRTSAAAAGSAYETSSCRCGDGCGPCRDLEIGFAGFTASQTAARPRAAEFVWLPAMVFAAAAAPSAAIAHPQATRPGRSPSPWPELQQSLVLRI